MDNHIIAGLPNGTDVLYRNRRDALNASNHSHIVAGVPAGTEIAERGPVRNGDPDESLNLIKNLQPRGLAKADYVETTAPRDATEAMTGPRDVIAGIRKAMQAPMGIEDLERGYAGREQAALAKAAEVKQRGVTGSALDNAPPIMRKVLGEFNEMVRRQVARRPL